MAGAAAFALPAPAAADVTPSGAVPAGDPGRVPEPGQHGTGGINDGDGDEAADVSERGISLSDDWLPAALASVVAAAVQAIWLRRRRDYRPTPLSERPTATDTARSEDEPDDQPLPTTAVAACAALARATDDVLPVAGVAAGGVDTLPRGGVGLIGAGAHAAARGLIVTTLLDPRRPRPARVALTPAAAHLLFGARDRIDAGGVAGSDATMPATVQILPEIAGITASGITASGAAAPDTDAPDTETPDTETPDTAVTGTGTPQAGVTSGHGAAGYDLVVADGLVFTDGTAPAAATAGTATGAPEPAAPTVILGPHPCGDTWTVAADGRVTGPPPLPEPVAGTADGGPPERLCVLARAAAVDLITLSGLAYPADQDKLTAPVNAAPTPATSTPAQHTAAPLVLTVLGAVVLAVRRPGAATAQPLTVRRSAARQILAYLAVHPHGATTDDLLDAIWPDLPHHSITSRLYTSISELRRTLRTAAGADPIDHAEHHYRLNPDLIDVDLWRLHAAAHIAVSANPADRRAALRAVVAVYAGDLAAGHTWPWIDRARENCRRTALDAYLDLARHTPDPDDALALLRDAQRVDPVNTAITDHLTELQRRLGRPSSA
jgi:hypothetical protein